MSEARTATLILGPEFDDSLRADLKMVLSDLGATFGQLDWSVGGSQEIESMKVSVYGQSLLIEAETYVGLSISGPGQLVAEIERRIKARRVRR